MSFKDFLKGFEFESKCRVTFTWLSLLFATNPLNIHFIYGSQYNYYGIFVIISDQLFTFILFRAYFRKKKTF